MFVIEDTRNIAYKVKFYPFKSKNRSLLLTKFRSHVLRILDPGLEKLVNRILILFIS